MVEECIDFFPKRKQRNDSEYKNNAKKKHTTENRFIAVKYAASWHATDKRIVGFGITGSREGLLDLYS